MIDVDDTICRCAQYPWGIGMLRFGAVYQVELDHGTFWLCLECLVGLEEW